MTVYKTWARTNADHCYASGGKFHIEDDATDHQSTVSTTPFIPVTAGKHYVGGVNLAVSATVGGQMMARIFWYTFDGTYLSSSLIVTLTAVTSEAWHPFDVTAPDTASWATLYTNWVYATGACAGTAWGWEFAQDGIFAQLLGEARDGVSGTAGTLSLVKRKTDAIPASPAAVGSAMTLTSAYDKAMDDVLTPLAIVGDTVDAVKLKSDTIGGAGAIAWPYTLTTDYGTPIPDAEVWITSDEAGNSVVASGRTNANGVITFYLDAGTVYVWAQKSGYNFTNPDLEVVS